MLIELSYIISLDMPKWPTNPAERIEYNTVIQNGDPSGCLGQIKWMIKAIMNV